MICEKCWADAQSAAQHQGGEGSTHYHRLIEERKDTPCTSQEQAGPYWNEARQADQRVLDMIDANNHVKEEVMQGPGGQVGVDLPPQHLGAKPPDPIEELFTYHKATPEQEIAYLNIRSQAKALVRIIDAMCPPGPDRTTAVRKIREAVMTANASIATGNAQYR